MLKIEPELLQKVGVERAEEIGRICQPLVQQINASLRSMQTSEIRPLRCTIALQVDGEIIDLAVDLTISM